MKASERLLSFHVQSHFPCATESLFLVHSASHLACVKPQGCVLVIPCPVHGCPDNFRGQPLATILRHGVHRQKVRLEFLAVPRAGLSRLKPETTAADRVSLPVFHDPSEEAFVLEPLARPITVHVVSLGMSRFAFDAHVLPHSPSVLDEGCKVACLRGSQYEPFASHHIVSLSV